MDTVEAIQTRRSIRAYDSKPVERHLIESVIYDAACAPPPLSGQTPWVFNVIEGVKRISAYGDRAKKFAAYLHPNEPGWSWSERSDFKVFWEAPALIVISGPVEDCSRAGQNLMLSAHARGLGTCWVGSPMLWLQNPETKKELGLPEGLAPVSALCLGYPASVPQPQIRQPPPIIWSE